MREEQENREKNDKIPQPTACDTLHIITQGGIPLSNSDQSGKIRNQIEENWLDEMIDGGQYYDDVNESHIRVEHYNLFEQIPYIPRDNLLAKLFVLGINERPFPMEMLSTNNK